MQKSNQLEFGVRGFLNYLGSWTVLERVLFVLDNLFNEFYLYRMFRGGFWRAVDASSGSFKDVRYVRTSIDFIDKYNRYLKDSEKSVEIRVVRKK